MKRGLNFTDVNTLRLGIQSGWSVELIARECNTYPEVITKYMESIKDQVQEWQSQAPTTGIDMDLLKAQIKAELLAEMRGAVVTEVIDPTEIDYEEMTEEDLEEATGPEEEEVEEDDAA